MLIALTGATGFVGRAVVATLTAAGHKVRALVRSGTAHPAGVEIVSGDLLDEAALARLCDGADAVVHVAGRISALSRADYFETNERGTVLIVQAAAAAGVKRFIHLSSLSARRPELTAYGASKAAGEAAVAAHGGGMACLIIRPPAVYGPGDKATLPLLRAFTSNPVVLAGAKASRFSLIHVGDLACIIAEAVAATRTGLVEVDDGKPGGYGWQDLVDIAATAQSRALRPYFLPRPLCMGVAAVIETAARIAGRPSMISRDKIRELYADNWVSAPPGWPLATPTGFAAGFASTLDWYRKAGWLPQRRRAT